MDKPVIVVREEVRLKIAEIINSSHLPAFIIEPILSEFLNETHIAAQNQYEIEKARYEQALKDEVGQ